ncbi:uncharacterized protein [Montipora foliosa]|uniref:uncharacterized protein isoform X3 n=1 Tax=Montipora foliosa TaxID=591990 RepID=UPI0035F170C2
MAQGGLSVEAEEIFAQSKEALDITLLGSEWNSSAGALSTLNRELAIHLSQQPHVRVSVLVPEGACKDEDKKAAQNFGINVLDAGQQPGFSEPLDWLCFPPEDHRIDVVVGHGVKLGRQVNVIKRSPQFQNCKWVHVVHTAPEDLSKYKGYDNPTSRGEQKHWDEVGLCKYADLVVPVGPRLKKAYSSYLQGCKKDEDIFEIVPGLFNREFGGLVQQSKIESDDDFNVLLCGRGDDEDFELKGYDIAVKAFADERLKGKGYYLLFVGAPDGKQDEVRRRLLNCGITDEQLTVRKFVQSRSRMRDLFSEVDLVIMPSKSEGFGLVALEALSASLPVLVGSNSGFARAIKSIPLGTYSIVDSKDPGRWAEAIECVSVRHRVCLEESKLLREAYGREYCWKRQCEALVDKLWSMVHESSTCQASAAESSVEEQPSAIPGAFCQADTTTMQQQAVQKGALPSYRKNAKKSSQGKTSKSNPEEGLNANEIRQRSKLPLPVVTKKKKLGKNKVSGTCTEELFLPEFGGTDSSGIAKVHLQRPEEQLPAITSGSLHDHPSVHKQKINEDTDTSKTSGDELSLSEFGDTLIKLLISAPGLQKEQQEVVYEILALQVQNFVKFHDHSTDDLQGVIALTEFIKNAYQVNLKAVNIGSLEIIVDCPTLKSLERLWNDYLSGHLNNVTERYLVTIEMKQQLGLETISLKTTIEEENYLTCKHVLLEMPGGLDSAYLSSQQGVLDQGASTSGMNTTADYKKVKRWDTSWAMKVEKAKVKEQDTSWAMRMEKSKVSRSALHRASINGQYEEVNMHLKNGANVDERDKFLLTPLHLACWYGHESVVKLLLDHNADVNALDRFQFTPLQKAEHCNHQSIIQLLLDHDAKPSFQQPLSLRTLAKRAFLRTDSHSGFNVLQAVVLQGDYDSVYKASTLLENFVEQMKCETISNNASIFRGKAAVDILSSAMAWRKPGYTDIEKLYRRLVGIDETVNELHSCAKSGDVEKVIELVLNDGIDVNVAAKSNITPLLLASGMSSGVLIKTLIDLGADVNAQTAPRKEGPLVFAASSNNYMVARVLLEHSADANIKDLWGETPLYKAVMQKNVPLVELLLENKADANIQDWVGETPLHKAVMRKDVHLVKILLENKADANIQDRAGETPLHKAVMRKDVPLVKILLENKADANIQDRMGETPLRKAVMLEDLPLVKVLIENKADANIQDLRGETPLHQAVMLEDLRLVKVLIENKADANIQDLRGETPLHKAVMLQDLPLVKVLIENKADASIQDLRGETPLHQAVMWGSKPLVKLFLENKADANIQNQEGETPLHKAVMLEDLLLVKVLIENKADANIQDLRGETPIHQAVMSRSKPLVKLFLENKADANIQNQEGETPLHEAVMLEDFPVVKVLIENKADANIQDLRGETPLHKAVMLEDLPLVKVLIENKADANIQNQWGNTPLHQCAHYGFSDTSQMLIESGCNINLKNTKGETPSDIESSRRQWSKRPSARYSQDFESSTPQWRFHREWLDLTKIEPEPEDVTEADDLHVVLPQVARLPYGSKQSLEEVVREADEKWPSKGVLMKKQQELSSLEKETQARLTRQPEMTKEVKEKGQAS